MAYFRLAAVFFLATGLASACGDDSSSSSGANPNDAGPIDSGPVVTCEKDPRVDTYVANLTKTSTGGGLKVTLMASDPAPPIRGTNNWTLRVTDGAGKPLSNAGITVVPFMPDHGHGTSVKPTVAAQDDGKYSVTNVYFFMPGVWRVTVAMPSDAGAGESALFFFCVPG
jgi:hypothetical protein